MDDKDKYISNIEERLRELAGQVDEMMWKTSDFTRKTRKRFRKSAERFRENQKTLSEKVSGIKSAGGRSWKNLSEGLTRAVGELEKGFEKAVHEFKQGETTRDADESSEKKVEV
jgi:dsDNA-specific endonuclease/ATPase MutS2